MAWHPDVPDIPIKKPKEIEDLEQMDRAFLDSMPSAEVNEKIEQIAHALARDYKIQVANGSYDECLQIVSVALILTGSAVGGHIGSSMIAAGNHAALKASKDAFPTP